MLGVSAQLARRSDAGPEPYDLSRVSTLLPLPARACEVLDFTGKWSRERQPQRRPLGHGSHVREVRRGKPGLDSPYLLAAGVTSIIPPIVLFFAFQRYFVRGVAMTGLKG